MNHRKYTYDNFTLTLNDTGQNKDSYHKRVSYTLRKDKEIIFTGRDFGTPQGMPPTGKLAAANLLGFLTLEREDTDEEYFKDYTPRQWQFVDEDAENLKLWGMQLEGDYPQ